jgi:hypothetical protein
VSAITLAIMEDMGNYMGVAAVASFLAAVLTEIQLMWRVVFVQKY